MLCLSESLCHDDPSVQRLLSAGEDAHSLTELLVCYGCISLLLAIGKTLL